MILVSHPTGNANVHHAAQAFAEADLLDSFWTCVGWNSHSPVNRLLPRPLRNLLCRRTLPDLLQRRAHCSPWRELGRHVSWRLNWAPLVRHETGYFSIDAVYQSLDREVARAVARLHGLTGVYAYEDGAAATFTAAKARGLQCFYDLPIGYWRAAQKIYAEEAEREPEWACTLSGILDSPKKLARKESELQLADAVFVASSFTQRTIRDFTSDSKVVEVIPYGAPRSGPAPAAGSRGGKLRVLFVGGLSQRKGLSYLIEAIEMVGRAVELTMVGQKTNDHCRPLNAATHRHRWIPSLPHAAVLAEMGRHDVLVFPSLFEGFGLVILEAMSQGIPVITTAHTAGPDVIRNGEDGFIVPIRSSESIAVRLGELAGDPERLIAMKRSAHTAAGSFAWSSYREKLVHAVRAGEPQLAALRRD